ncbi:6339_t:CDS:2 [Paraglomus occultum]|uniref:6339_t:CDS:1 n=1 Tax=Paraglomus occultum TaxID=144539 RepID=A0A9N8WI54_9GLOM|nr:6339_t:CDS:2 [Paraglomus occultum]
MRRTTIMKKQFARVMGYCAWTTQSPKPQKKYRENDEAPRSKYRTVDGRLYLNIAESQYPLPVYDEEEMERLALQHAVFKHFWHGLYSSPITELLHVGGAKVLDSGSGTGSWVIDMSIDFPRSEFVGIDISPMSPTTNLPHNVSFFDCNLLEGLPFAADSFDYVRQGLLFEAFTEQQWETHVVNELVRVTRVGGWVEFMEGYCSFVNPGRVTKRLTNAFSTFLKSKGISMRFEDNLTTYLENTCRLSNISYEEQRIPLGKRGGRFGELALKNLIWTWLALKKPLADTMCISSEHFDALIETFVREATENRTEWRTFRVYAQKTRRNVDSAIDIMTH